MARFLSQNWLLSRRHLLRGAGTSLALPLLNCMSPLAVRGAAPAEKPRRSVFVYVPNGVNMLTWQMTEAGRGYRLTAPLASLERHRERITPISGMSHGNGIGSRHECDKIWLTGAKATQEAATFRNTVSVDQLMAEKTTDAVRFASLELSIGRGNVTLAHSREGVPLPAENDPKTVFNRLFGIERGGVAAQQRNLDRRQSLLDTVLEDARSTRMRLGSEDRVKLDEYLDAVRSVEARTERSEAWLNVPKPKIAPTVAAHLSRVIPKTDAGDYYRTMYDLIVLALQTDMTRVVTYLSGSESNGLGLPEISVPQTRHELSHHNGDPEQLRRLTAADTFLVEQFAYFLDRLQATDDGGTPLLDRTMVLFGSGMSYGHVHANANLPLVFAGGSGLGLKHGTHLDYNLPKIKKYDATPAGIYGLCGRPVDDKALLSNLLLTMLQKMGVNAERFVDSLGPVSELQA